MCLRHGFLKSNFLKRGNFYLLQLGFTRPLESASHTVDLLLRSTADALKQAAADPFTSLTVAENICTIRGDFIFKLNKT